MLHKLKSLIATLVADWAALADAAKGAADRAGAAIDDALDFIGASDQRIAAMEHEHRGRPQPART